MSTVVDFSFGHAEITPAALKKVDGCIGGIAYAGCADTAKNITKAELHALLNAGYQMGLVIENNVTDLKGHAHGRALGAAIVNAARALEFDLERCRLWTPYDTNAGAGDYAEILSGMLGFASAVPNPGYYGDSDSIDYLHARRPEWGYWQSDSTSFSPKNPTPNAHLLQHYADHRAQGLPVDVNDVVRTPIGLMGEPTEEDHVTPQDIEAIADAVYKKVEAKLEKMSQDRAGDPRKIETLVIDGVRRALAEGIVKPKPKK